MQNISSKPTPKYDYNDVARLGGNPSSIEAKEFQNIMQRDAAKSGALKPASNKEGITKAEFLEKQLIDGNGHVLTTDEKTALFDRMQNQNEGNNSLLTPTELSAHFNKYAQDSVMDKNEWTAALGTTPTPTECPQGVSEEDKKKIKGYDAVNESLKENYKQLKLVDKQKVLNALETGEKFKPDTDKRNKN